MSHEDNEFSHILYEARMYIITYRFVVGNQDFTNLVRANHSIHLRNLAYFFCKEKQGHFWHATDFVNGKNQLQPIPGKLFRKISRYASGAVGHLCDDRLSDTYKAETQEFEDKAFPLLVDAIWHFLRTLNEDVSLEYQSKWEDPFIQDVAQAIEGLCNLHKAGGGCILLENCEVNKISTVGFFSDGVPERFYVFSNGLFIPVR